MSNNNPTPNLSNYGLWTGIIAPEKFWRKNIEASRWSNIDELPGWGTRYAVRIFGKHSPSKEILPDDKLPLCEVIFPVTAGTGHGSSWQSSNLRQGSVVVGYYLDPLREEQPIIVGCIGNNDQTVIPQEQKNGFDVYTGFTDNITIPHYAITGQDPDSIKGEPANKKTSARESNTGSSPQEDTVADEVLIEDEEKTLATSETCEVVKLADVSVTIKNLIKGIESNKSQLKSWKAAVNKNDGSDIQTQLDEATELISTGLKGIIGSIQPWIEEQISAKLREAFQKLNPAQQGPAQDLIDVAMQEIHCLFRRIIDQLFQTVGQFLQDNIEKYINVPLCAVENIVGTLVGNAVAVIEDGILGALEDIVSLIETTIEIGEDILGFIQDVLEFSFCDGKVACPELDSWKVLGGAGFDPLEVPDPLRIISKARNTASKIKTVASGKRFKDLKEKGVFDLTGIIDDTVDTCNLGAISCGPPQVQIFGGGGVEAAANAVVSASGKILAVDITNYGFNFDKEPFIKIVDPCGRGSGAVAKIRTVKNPPPAGTILNNQVIETPFIRENILKQGDDIFDKNSALSTFDKKYLRNKTIKVTFSCTRDENSGSFFQFKIPNERRLQRTVAGKRQFSISTADIPKNRIEEFTFKMAAGLDYSVEAFIGVSKEKLKITDETRLGAGTKEEGARGELFNRERLRIPLANKRIRIANKIKRITRAANKSIKAGTAISLDDIARRKRGIQNRFKLRYTNLSSANSPIFYKPEQLKNFTKENTNDETVTLKDGTKTSILQEAKKFIQEKGNGRIVGRRLFFRDASGDNINGVLMITQLDDRAGAGRGVDGSYAEFTENGRNVFAVDPTRDTRFRITLIYKDGARQKDRIFDKLTINKQEFDILGNVENELTESGLGVIERNFKLEGVGVDEKEIPDRDPDGLYNDLVIVANKGYFYFDRTKRKYFFRVDPSPEDLESEALESVDISKEVRQYSIVANKTKVKRKESVVFDISTLGLENGTALSWLIKPIKNSGNGITASDFKKVKITGTIEQEYETDVLYGTIYIKNNSGKIKLKMSDSASIGDAFKVNLGSGIKNVDGERAEFKKSLAKSQVVTVVEDASSLGDFEPPIANISDINTIGIGSTTFGLIPSSDIEIIDIEPIDTTPIGITSITDTIGAGDTNPNVDVTSLVTAGNIEFDGDFGVSIQDVVIIEPGSGYSTSFTGDLGGLGRVWALKSDTISQTIDGKWNVPTPPGFRVCYSAGDKVTLPANTTVITEPRDGKGGGETIVGGSEYVLTNDGCITTPDPTIDNFDTPIIDIDFNIDFNTDIDPPPPPPGPTPTTLTQPPPTQVTPPTTPPPPPGTPPGPTPPPTTPPPDQPPPPTTPPDQPPPPPGTPPTPPTPPVIPPTTVGYEVDLCLKEITVIDPGFGYTEDDIIIINPSNGAEAEFTLGPFGTVESVRLLEFEKFCGFKDTPEITIQSPTGRNVKLVPVFEINRIPLDTVEEAGTFEKYITVIDCVGRAPEQDFFRVPD